MGRKINSNNKIDGYEPIFSRNSYIERQSILLLGAEIFALLNKDVHSIMGDVNLYLIKLSAFFLVFSILFLAFSTLHSFKVKSSLWLIGSSNNKDDSSEELIELSKESSKLFFFLGKWGINFWEIGAYSALLSVLIFLFRVD